MAKRKWNHVRMHPYYRYQEGREFPEDGVWSVWKDNKGNIEIARLKYDAEIHFFPPTEKLDKNIENLIAWRPLRKKEKTRRKLKSLPMDFLDRFNERWMVEDGIRRRLL